MKLTFTVEELDGIWIAQIDRPLTSMLDILGKVAPMARKAYPTKEMLVAAMPALLEEAIKTIKETPNARV